MAPLVGVALGVVVVVVLVAGTGKTAVVLMSVLLAVSTSHQQQMIQMTGVQTGSSCLQQMRIAGVVVVVVVGLGEVLGIGRHPGREGSGTGRHPGREASGIGLAMMSLPGLMPVIGAAAGPPLGLKEEQLAVVVVPGAMALVERLQQQMERTGGCAVGPLGSPLEQQQLLVGPASGRG
jgi:hypothetical protein